MQATTRVTRWRARHRRVRPPRLGGRTLTYRELWRRARVAGIYTRNVPGFRRALRDMVRATPTAPFLLGIVDPQLIAEDARALRG